MLHMTLPTLTTPRTRITVARPADAPALARYYARNAAHLAPWEPKRPGGYHDEARWRERLEDMGEDIAEGFALPFVARLPEVPDEIFAVCNLSAIARGPFQACAMGYSIDAGHEGQGLMREVVGAVVGYALGPLGLNRVMASHLPENTRSAALLAKLGFEREGMARRYLKIAGEWRDHVLNSKLAPESADL
ncbi:MAG: GNAT family N-acetyltransferase [Maritimibacter sp.]